MWSFFTDWLGGGGGGGAWPLVTVRTVQLPKVGGESDFVFSARQIFTLTDC